MKHLLLWASLGCLATWAYAAEPNPAITTGTLLDEMANLEHLARWPDPAYRTIQFSSYDRRSTTSEAPGWFANADGFGEEPIPDFQRVLREPKDNQPGLFLVAQATGPGAIVRGWSAGMDGVLRVHLDPEGVTPPIYEGPAYGFLARRSAKYLEQAQSSLKPGNAFAQQDADYLPIPFAKGLYVTWEGKLNELHFYHLQTRLYPAGTAVRDFNPQTDLKTYAAQLSAAADHLRQPATPGNTGSFAVELAPGKAYVWTETNRAPGAIRLLQLKVRAEALDQALRGCLLRLAFDGSQRPQVEAPVGDFFGSGPGINPFESLPMTVRADGTCQCRFVMPFEKSARLELVNYAKQPVTIEGAIAVEAWAWDERSMYFRAKWRADHDLLAGEKVLDMPFLFAMGKGVFAGCAAMLMNPTGVPTAGGNWWGEGDEKFFVDSEPRPSTFGTGSEDYFNYAWSRPDLFSEPYCGQPLDSGPDTAGYVSNHRFQVLDAIPFAQSLAALIELRTHNLTPGLSYARLAYHYARPGAIDDHRALMPSDLIVPTLPAREPQALGGATDAKFYHFSELNPQPTAGTAAMRAFPLATRLKVLHWPAAKGEKMSWRLPVAKAGKQTLHLVAVHAPGGAEVRLLLNGKPVLLGGGGDVAALRAAPNPRVLNVHYQPVDLPAGEASLALECVTAGAVDLDYLWLKPE